MDLFSPDPSEIRQMQATAEAEIMDEMRRQNDLRRALLMYVDSSMMLHHRNLSAQLLNKREADTLRGKIGELQKLRQLIQNGGST